jgi:hypothetical protein
MVTRGVGGWGRRGIVIVLIKGSRPASNHITESEHDTLAGRYKKWLGFRVVWLSIISIPYSHQPRGWSRTFYPEVYSTSSIW